MRHLREPGAELMSRLVGAAGITADIESLLVVELQDGGMGSLGIGHDYANREFGCQVAECEFLDWDGVVVLAALNLDQAGELFELDIFKSDFSPTEALRQQ